MFYNNLTFITIYMNDLLIINPSKLKITNIKWLLA